MNSRQRRGVILLVLSVLCAIGAFAGVLSVIRDANSKVGPETDAYELKADVAPYKELEPEHEQNLRLYRNGVAEDLILQYGDFSVRTILKQLEKLPAPDC